MTSKLKERTTGHDSSLLIFDEPQYEPFTESRWWAGGNLKIARPRPPATFSRMPGPYKFRSHRDHRADGRAEALS